MRRGPRRAGLAALAGALAGLLAAAPAGAHTVGGVTPTNYRSELTLVTPPLAGVSVSLSDLGRRVRLTNRSGADLVVLGYSGEPYLRVGRDGVEVNLVSPTYDSAVGAPASAPPEWHLRSPGTTATWSDRRTFWSGPAAPGVARAPGVEQIVVPAWAIPVRLGTAPAHIVGRIVWVPGPSVWPWLGLALAIALVTLAVAGSPWWGGLLSACVAVMVAFDAVHTWGIATAPGGGLGADLTRLLVAGGFSVAAWIIGALAINPLQRRREGGLLAAAIAGAVIAIFGGLGDISSLARSQLPVVYPAGLVRVAVAASLGLGSGVVAGAVLRLRAIPVEQAANQGT